MKKLLILCSRRVKKSILAHRTPDDVTFTFATFRDFRTADDARELIAETTDIDGVLGLSDTPVLIASIIAAQRNLPGPTPESVLACQNKYHTRRIQRNRLPEAAIKSVVVDDAVKQRLADAGMAFPLFIKPEKSAFSLFSFRVENLRELKAARRKWQRTTSKRNRRYRALFDLLPTSAKRTYPFANRLVAEETIDLPIQITVDGWVADGDIYLFGATTSHFLPNTLSFDYFHFPHPYESATIKKKIEQTTRELVRAVNIDRTLFNVEIAYDPQTETVKIIEINARPSSQFMPLIHRVRGTHPIDAAVALALGRKPQMERTRTKTDAVARCYILRRKTDALVKQAPKWAELRSLEKQLGDVKIDKFIHTGKRLSDIHQDAFTYRFAQFLISGHSVTALKQRRHPLEKKITSLFTFEN